MTGSDAEGGFILDENAYLTVEAALVFPIVLMIQLLIILLFIFQYNRCLLNQDMNRMVVLGCGASEQDKVELAGYLKKCVNELYREKYVAWELNPVELTVEKNKICARGQGKLWIPIFGRQIWNGGDFWGAAVSCEMKKLQPVFVIRQARKLKPVSP